MWRRRTHGIACVLLAVATIVNPAKASATTRRHDVYFLGDSVMEGAASDLPAGLPGWNATVDTFVGRFLEAGLDAIRVHRAEMHDIVVVHLGNQVRDLRDLDRTIDQTMQLLQGVDEVVWVTTHNRQPYEDAVNRALWAAPWRWPNIEIVDWDAIARSTPAALYQDGTHLTPTGRRVYADALTAEVRRWADPEARCAPPSEHPAPAPTPSGRGYWLLSTEGRVYPHGAPFLGDLASRQAIRPAVSMAATSSGNGYWILTGDGGVEAFGDAPFLGSLVGTPHDAPPRQIVAAPRGGYWILTSDGGVFSFGAPFFGSLGNLDVSVAVVGMAADPAGRGYWLATTDGGVFSFGSAPFHGSATGLRLRKPVLGIASDTAGYRLLTGDGGILTFGDGYAGSTAGLGLCTPRTVAVAGTGTPGGYWTVSPEGAVHAFGDAVDRGGNGDLTPGARVVAMASA